MYKMKLNLDIICLQETHIQKHQSKLLEASKLRDLYVSLAQQKKGGIAIYIRKHLQTKQVYADKEGRILMLEVYINYKKMLLTMIYAPNEKQEKFYTKLYRKLVEREYENICLLGDFNAIANLGKDYNNDNPGEKRKRKTLPKVFYQMAEELGLKDVWRERNPDKKQYTYYSAPHTSWSRLDMLWTNVEIECNIKEIEIETNT
uniref:exodeoxyribonuclease III n=1 Tax=Naja naja TaxID=35670 RepID=A0A8C6XRB0_NAJNA